MCRWTPARLKHNGSRVVQSKGMMLPEGPTLACGLRSLGKAEVAAHLIRRLHLNVLPQLVALLLHRLHGLRVLQQCIVVLFVQLPVVFQQLLSAIGCTGGGAVRYMCIYCIYKHVL